MPEHKGVKCSLLIQGEAAEEHGYHLVDEKTCKVHIAAESGMKYSFKFDLSGTGAARHCLRLNVDEKRLQKLTTPHATINVEEVKFRREDGQSESYKLVFNDVATVDQISASVEIDAETISDIGTIEWIVIRAIKEVIPLRDSTRSPPPDTHTNPKEVHESDVKGRGILHRTVLEDPTIVPDPYYQRCHATKLDSLEEPWVRFIFRYTSRGVLQSEGLIPKDPVPEPKIDDDVAGMSLEEAQRELMRMRDALRESTGSKDIKDEVKEEGDTKTRMDGKLKHNADLSCSGDGTKRQKVGTPEVIDLTQITKHIASLDILCI